MPEANSLNESRILLEDNHLLVIDKPAPLATMGVRPDTPSLLARAREYIGRKYNKPGNVYLGVVSRLDSFVTGAVIFARTSKAASRISKQFRDGTIDKTYWAIIPADDDSLPANEPGESGFQTLEHMIYKDDARRRMFAVDADAVPSRFQGDARTAELKYKVIGSSESSCLIQIQLITGRKHQIRAQLAAIGRPVVGDRKYGSEEPFEPGIALHCRSLQFEHPTLRTRIEIDCPPPKTWKTPAFRIS